MEQTTPGPIIGDDTQYETSKGVKPLISFEDMGLKKQLLKGIFQFGFEKPSAIQQRAIYPITQGPLDIYAFHIRWLFHPA